MSARRPVVYVLIGWMCFSASDAGAKYLLGAGFEATDLLFSKGLIGCLFFLAALSGGDAGAWLQGLFSARGREALEGQGRGDLLARLAQDFGQLGRMADLAGPDWRFLPIPLHDGQQVQQLRLFLRRRQKRRDGGDGDRGEATRFIVEVKLSRVGDLQLDGLVRDNRFDLMLRTRKALPAAMRYRIIEIFESAKAAAGYLGNVGFQASDDWTPMPLAGGSSGPQSLVI